MNPMRKRAARVLSVLAIVGVAALAFLLCKDRIWTSAKVQKGLELNAHRALIESIKTSGRQLNAFSTDGCSGGLSTAWRTVSNRFPTFAEAHESTPPWEPCCVNHDRVYHSAGGANEALESYALRLSADKTLKRCVFATRHTRSAGLEAQYGLTEVQINAAYEALANVIFETVRVGGLPCTGLAWRWGYGYPPCPSREEG